MVKKFEGFWLLKTPLHHGGNEKTGSTPILRTIYMYVDEENTVQIPYVSGNAVRGRLRRMVMKDFLDRIGVEAQSLNLKLYHSLFTGGVLESSVETVGTIDLELRRKIQKLLPPISLFGGAFGNQMIHSKLKVGHAFPVCKEYSQFLPDFLTNDKRAKIPVRVFTDEAFQTRRDDLRADREEDEQAVQMKVDFECFIPGTKFYHWFALEYPNDIELSCFAHAIELFKKSPYVGGKSGTGHGEIEFHYDGLGDPDPSAYLQFLENKKAEIVELLREIEKAL
jgi:hypothetical protein